MTLSVISPSHGKDVEQSNTIAIELLPTFRSAISSEAGINSGDVGLNTPFADLGIDPFMTFSILEIVQQRIGVELPASLFRDCNNLSEIQKTLGHGADVNGHSLRSSNRPLVEEIYRESEHLVGRFAAEAGVDDFWTKVYPSQKQLVLAYIVEAFAQLGCFLDNEAPGTVLSTPSGILAKHGRLVNTLFDILADGGLVERRNGNQVVRTSQPVDSTPSVVLFERLIQSRPLHAKTHRLLNITGPRLSECLTGAADPIKLLFGRSTSRDLLEEFYTNAPMSVAASKHLSALFRRIFSIKGDECIEILEIGAGFGGTTKFVLDMLVDAGIPFKYTFTDVSPSFFKEAKNRYANIPAAAGCVVYDVLDIEKTPPEKFLGRFHAVLSTNCIHATKDLTVSSTNARKLLRDGGFFALTEFRTRLYWLDLVFGLLDGWWLFKDDRKHCIADESFWKTSLEASGFSHVVWSEAIVDGQKPNPQVYFACTE
ncbi:Lovastatin diketide synthase LovF [Tolypocladium ophioglossoides CBS 100239]|uniref:Lovastatin diketide synthase LovF n=1 Tax=Tolypocladium ophioglossoides (strain CBS 100239) TaxID=1163406 RepID=A0A0L0N2B9_TOLOC|nr:Lovastatin diketide synthase LovF [Tolypocladium ophioglossoides CBS 100239]